MSRRPPRTEESSSPYWLTKLGRCPAHADPIGRRRVASMARPSVAAALRTYLCGRWLIDRQQHLEAGVARLRLHADVAVVATDDDAIADVETEAGAVADILGREEGLEDAPLQFGRDSRSRVADLDEDAVAFPGGPHGQRALAAHGVDGVVDEVGPDLIQLARLRADLGKAAVVVADNLHTLLELVAQDDQRALEPVVHVDRPEGALVEVAVVLHGRHQLGDAACGRADFADQSFDVEGGRQPPDGVGRAVTRARDDALHPGIVQTSRRQ